MSERWLPVVGYEGRYEVSDQGRVKSLLTYNGRTPGRILTQVLRPNGKMHVTLHGEVVKQQVRQVHRLVLEAFVGPCPPGQESLHANDIGDDNRLANLRWGTRSENMQDRVANGRHHYTKRDRCSRGHAYTPENTMPTQKGARRCRQCVSIEQKKRRGTV